MSIFGNSRATRQLSARLWRWLWNIMSISSATGQIISDWRDLLFELETGHVRLLVIGGYAVMKETEPYDARTWTCGAIWRMKTLVGFTIPIQELEQRRWRK
jgi:hypothetical protein